MAKQPKKKPSMAATHKSLLDKAAAKKDSLINYVVKYKGGLGTESAQKQGMKAIKDYKHKSDSIENVEKKYPNVRGERAALSAKKSTPKKKK